MSTPSKAFVIGGFSENHNALAGLATELTQGPFRLVDDVETITLGEAFRRREAVNKEAERRLVFLHSAAPLAVQRAGIVVAMNCVEPSSLMNTLNAALKCSSNKEVGHEEGVLAPGMGEAVAEVLRHPTTLRVPFVIRKFSTVQMLIDGGTEAFPEGRFYLPGYQDEYGFGGNDEIDRARANGITAQMQEGFHNQPLLRPRAALENFTALLNAA